MPIPKSLPALSAVLLVLAATAAGAQDSGADPRAGEALFESHQCWQCHGHQGQGGTAASRIGPTPYPFDAFAQLVRRTNLMPAYSPNVLSDEQLRQIYAFVRSIPEPPALEDIPELDFE